MAVLTPLGADVNGAQSWFILGPLSFQPVEFAKLALALWGAHVLVVKGRALRQYRHLLVPVVPVALLMFALVMLQPDLGGTVTLGRGADRRCCGSAARRCGCSARSRSAAWPALALLSVGAGYRLCPGAGLPPAR